MVRQLCVVVIWAASLGPASACTREFPQVEPLPIEAALRESLTKAVSADNASAFHEVVEEAFQRKDYLRVAKIGEFLHGFYDIEKRKLLIPDFATSIKTRISEIPDADKFVVVRGLGRATFLYENMNVLPSADLSATADVLMISARSESKEARKESFFWVCLIARNDPANADRIRSWALEGQKADREAYPRTVPGTLARDLLEIDGDLYGFGTIEQSARLPKYPESTPWYMCRDDELPRLDDKNANDIIALIAGIESREKGKYSAIRKSGWLADQLAQRTSPSELKVVLQYGLDRKNHLLIVRALESTFCPEYRVSDESRNVAKQFILANLADHVADPVHMKLMIDALNSFGPTGILDPKPSLEIYTATVKSWPMDKYESRLQAYRVLYILNRLGSDISQTISTFAKQADAYERAAKYTDEKERQAALTLLKPLLPPEPAKPVAAVKE